jgi:hypothetical protein
MQRLKNKLNFMASTAMIHGNLKKEKKKKNLPVNETWVCLTTSKHTTT